MSVKANSIGENINRVGNNRTPDGYTAPLFTIDHLRAFRPILSFLNAKDRDILYLVFVTGKKQKDIQRILGRSQPSLCYDIKRIRKRLKFIFYLDSVFDIFLNFIEDPPEGVFTPFEIEVITLMFYTSSFTLTSKILGNGEMSQVKVRYCFDKCLRKMEENRLWEIYEMFMVIRSNLNIVKRVYYDENSNEDRRDVYIPQ